MFTRYHTFCTTADHLDSIGYIISAIFACAEYQRLGIHFRQYRVLRASFWIKLAFIFVEIALAIGMFHSFMVLRVRFTNIRSFRRSW